MYYNFLIVHFYTHFYVIENIIVCAHLYLMIHLILYHNQPYYVTKNPLLGLPWWRSG